MHDDYIEGVPPVAGALDHALNCVASSVAEAPGSTRSRQRPAAP
jgi:hypothetical protein